MVCIAGPAPTAAEPASVDADLIARPLRVTRARDEGLYRGAAQGADSGPWEEGSAAEGEVTHATGVIYGNDVGEPDEVVYVGRPAGI